jgi:S-methylmethionine-dependent homocysteine/selenocysteine methylase
VALAKQARDHVADRPVALAGSMSPMAFGGNFSAGKAGSAVDAFRVQADALAETGVDLLMLEMMLSAEVAEPALQAAGKTGLPVWLGFPVAEVTPDDALITPAGTDVSALLELAQDRADAVLIMHTDIDVAEQALPLLTQPWRRPIGAYPHVGDWTPPNWVFRDISPAAFGAKVAPWASMGAQVLGGCCGIGPNHIAALCDAMPRKMLLTP